VVAGAGEPDTVAPAALETAVETASAPTAEALPWIHPSMPDQVREKLESAYEIAVQRVTDVPQCAELFTHLGADPLATLQSGLYFPASPARETSMCRRAMAQTYVGDAPTWICRRVSSYSDERVAVVVIHEALHHAGLTERPHDKNAMTSGAINTMVAKNCRL
jgi:hypothetical protein